MSIIHRLEDDEIIDVSLYELYSVLGERDTPKLYDEPYDVDVGHDCPWGAGNSVDRRTKYVDRVLYQQVMDGEFNATGLEPYQIIEAWLDHEHTEKCIIDGDNPIDTYYPGHKRALKREHERVLTVLGRTDGPRKIAHYETIIWPGLDACYKRPIIKPPMDLWCSPVLDNIEDEHDQEVVDRLVKAGVLDARKRSKYDIHYGFGKKPCDQCGHFNKHPLTPPQGEIAPCEIAAGLVRVDRHCDFWVERA